MNASRATEFQPLGGLLIDLVADVERFSACRVLCVGDIMLDRFIYGDVSRISPEAPIPVLNITDRQFMPGGAGNVVRNILSLGAKACIATVTGNDRIGQQLTNMMGEQERLTPYLLVEKGRKTTAKSRYIADGQQLLRADDETREPLNEHSTRLLTEILHQEIPGHDIVILSDYAKGVLTPQILAEAIGTAKKYGKRVIIDPKGNDYSIYSGAYLLSPNLNELCQAAGMQLLSEESIIASARKLMKRHDIGNILITRGKDGMTLVPANGDALTIPTRAREIFDVSGAGDTAIATLAVALAAGLPIENAAFLSNLAAGIVVGKIGTAVIYRTDLKSAIYTHDMAASQGKILPLDLAQETIENWKKDNKTIGFTNGCFDLMHKGHLALLQQARKSCDRLVVGLNSDSSVKRLKGESRPINGEMERAMMLAALEAVDLVVIFREDTPLTLLESFRPNLLIKGADYTKDQVVGADLVESYGGQVLLVPLQEGHSTTKMLERIKL